MHRPLAIFILHASDLLTDHRPHGDGLIAYGFITTLAALGNRVHVAAERVALERPLPPGVTIHMLEMRTKNPTLRRVEYALRARALFERLRRSIHFDVVHQLNPVHGGLSLGMVGSKLPIILGPFAPRWPDDKDELVARPATLQSRLGRLAIAPLLLAQQVLAKALLVVSPAALDRFPLQRLFARRIFEVHYGVDISLFVPQHNGSPLRDNTILFLANLGERKGMYTLLEAFEIVAARRPNARLIMAGSGWGESALTARIARMDAKANVVFLGRVARDTVPEVMSQASIYCLPSYGEPNAMSVIEAMACEKAIVVTDRGGLPYMFPRDGGLLVPVRDAPALAEALITLLDAPARVAAMGRANRAFAEEQYTWPKVGAQLERVYRRVLHTAQDG